MTTSIRIKSAHINENRKIWDWCKENIGVYQKDWHIWADKDHAIYTFEKYVKQDMILMFALRWAGHGHV